MLIPDPDHRSWFFTIPGSRGQKGTGSRIRIRNTGLNKKSLLSHLFLWNSCWCSCHPFLRSTRTARPQQIIKLLARMQLQLFSVLAMSCWQLLFTTLEPLQLLQHDLLPFQLLRLLSAAFFAVLLDWLLGFRFGSSCWRLLLAADCCFGLHLVGVVTDLILVSGEDLLSPS